MIIKFLTIGAKNRWLNAFNSENKYYHATNKKNLPSIMTNGLLINPPSRNYAISDRVICLTETSESAGYWFDGDAEDMAILEINGNLLDGRFEEDRSGCAYLYTENIPPQAINLIEIPMSIIEKVKKRNDHFKERNDEYLKRYKDWEPPKINWEYLNK